MEAVLIIFMVATGFVVLPLAIFMHYVTKWKATQGLSQDEEQMLEELWRKSQAMESRINALEDILDDEVPDWRKRL
ncbi:MAG TPA: envelope stress response membrane protein PspB [Gammaproteobacteria bacterium]|jgi:phage shock protein B